MAGVLTSSKVSPQWLQPHHRLCLIYLAGFERRSAFLWASLLSYFLFIHGLVDPRPPGFGLLLSYEDPRHLDLYTRPLSFWCLQLDGWTLPHSQLSLLLLEGILVQSFLVGTSHTLDGNVWFRRHKMHKIDLHLYCLHVLWKRVISMFLTA